MIENFNAVFCSADIDFFTNEFIWHRILADRYGTDRLENACAKALSYTPNPSLKNISTILKNGQDKVVLTSESARVSNKESLKYGITRGASYYKGGDRS